MAEDEKEVIEVDEIDGEKDDGGEDNMDERLGVLEETFADLKSQYNDGDITWEEMLQELITFAEAEMGGPEEIPEEVPGPDPFGSLAGNEEGLSIDQLS
jgi:hypothetical protein